MTIRVGVNGFGRIGRNFFRAVKQSGADVVAKKEVYGLLNKLAEEGKAILFISSELGELLGVTDRILVMRRGKLVGNLKTSETSQEEIMHLAAVEEANE